MVPVSHPFACDRARGQVSLELDGELSQLERALLRAHVRRCADCRAYREEVRAFTRALRTAPLERGPAISVRRYRRTAATRLQAGVAAAMAFAVVGVASQMVPGREDGSSFSTFRVSQFQTQNQLEQEQALIEGTSGTDTTASGDATMR